MIEIKKLLFLSVMMLLSHFYAQSQVFIPGDYFNAIDKSDTSKLTFYTSLSTLKSDSINWLNPYVKFSYNSDYARSYDDGAIWKGKGATIETHVGFQAKKGRFSLTFFPTLYFSQNQTFDLAPQRGSNPIFNYQYTIDGGIDWVQRYGDKPFLDFHLGQSELKFDAGLFSASLSTQNYSVGSSTFNPIIMSRQAGGFPHLRMGLDPFLVSIKNINVGHFEYNMIYGLLKESDYFDTEDDNNSRYLSALFIAYRPSFLPEFKIGVNRLVYTQTNLFETEDLYALFYNSSKREPNNPIGGNDRFDQMASFTAEWYFKQVNARFYFEYAINDFLGTLHLEPDHARGFSVGFDKEVQTKKGSVLIQYEHTNLSGGVSFRPEPLFYAHGVNRQGYTHNGQIIGSGIGPGGNSDNLNIMVKKEKLSFGFWLTRIEFNRDFFDEYIQLDEFHDQEYTLSFFYLKELEKWDIFGSVGYSYNFNRYFENDQQNLSFSMGTRMKIFK